MNTTKIQVEADDGTQVTLVVPTEIPTNERADYLRKLWDDNVVELDGHWKGRVQADVPVALEKDMTEAMEFMGAPVTVRGQQSGARVRLFSTGYWAHGF